MKNYNLSKKNGKLMPCLFLLAVIFFISTAVGLSSVPKTWAAKTIEVYQKQGDKIFGKNTSLDIFNDPKYGGQRLIAPYSKGTYVFEVRNSCGEALPYTIDIEAINPDNLPIILNIKKNGSYIYGGEHSMLPLSALNLPEKLLAGNTTDIFTLGWAWDESQTDPADTAIGKVSAEQYYTIIINATGSIEEKDGPKTGDNSNIFLWVVLITISALFIFILVFFKRREKDDEDTKNIPERL